MRVSLLLKCYQSFFFEANSLIFYPITDVAARERREQFAATLAATQLSQRYGDEFDDLLVLDKTTSSQMARAAAQVDEFRHTLPAAAAASVALTPSESTLASSVFALSFTQIPISGGSGMYLYDLSIVFQSIKLYIFPLSQV
jgi:hypothetical protein